MKKKIIKHIIVFAALALYLVFVRFCPFRELTGIPCPFCGLTRAYLALFQFDLKSAFSFHPLFLFIPVLILFSFHFRLFKIKEKAGNLIIIAGTALVFAVYIIRFQNIV